MATGIVALKPKELIKQKDFGDYFVMWVDGRGVERIDSLSAKELPARDLPGWGVIKRNDEPAGIILTLRTGKEEEITSVLVSKVDGREELDNLLKEKTNSAKNAAR